MNWKLFMCIINFESSLDNDNTNDGNCGWKNSFKT